MGLSYLPQGASIFRKLTVEENIRAVLELQLDGQGRRLPAARQEGPRPGPSPRLKQLTPSRADRVAGSPRKFA